MPALSSSIGFGHKKNFGDSLLQNGEYPPFLHFQSEFSKVVSFPPSCFVRLRVNSVFSYSDIQTFQTVSLCPRSLIFSEFYLLFQ